MAYKKDYERSKKAEDTFEALLASKYNLLTSNTANKGYFPFFDVESTSTTTGAVCKYEVKLNACYLDKEDVVIENCRLVDEKIHPSGLSLTEADYYIFKFECDTNFYMIPVLKLKELVATPNPNKRFIVDKKGFQLHIFTKDYLLPLCTIL